MREATLASFLARISPVSLILQGTWGEGGGRSSRKDLDASSSCCSRGRWRGMFIVVVLSRSFGQCHLVRSFTVVVASPLFFPLLFLTRYECLLHEFRSTNTKRQLDTVKSTYLPRAIQVHRYIDNNIMLPPLLKSNHICFCLFVLLCIYLFLCFIVLLSFHLFTLPSTHSYRNSFSSRKLKGWRFPSHLLYWTYDSCPSLASFLTTPVEKT